MEKVVPGGKEKRFEDVFNINNSLECQTRRCWRLSRHKPLKLYFNVQQFEGPSSYQKLMSQRMRRRYNIYNGYNSVHIEPIVVTRAQCMFSLFVRETRAWLADLYARLRHRIITQFNSTFHSYHCTSTSSPPHRHVCWCGKQTPYDTVEQFWKVMFNIRTQRTQWLCQFAFLMVKRFARVFAYKLL